MVFPIICLVIVLLSIVALYLNLKAKKKLNVAYQDMCVTRKFSFDRTHMIVYDESKKLLRLLSIGSTLEPIVHDVPDVVLGKTIALNEGKSNHNEIYSLVYENKVTNSVEYALLCGEQYLHVSSPSPICFENAIATGSRVVIFDAASEHMFIVGGPHHFKAYPYGSLVKAMIEEIKETKSSSYHTGASHSYGSSHSSRSYAGYSSTTSYKILQDLNIKISTNNFEEPTVYIPIFSGTLNMNDKPCVYNEIKAQADKIVDTINLVASGKKKGKKTKDAMQPVVSLSDELLKLSELVEKGILSQEEFEIQKKRLLQ